MTNRCKIFSMIADVDPCITIIGGTGFIGSRLVERLLADGARVRVMARDPAKCRNGASIGSKLELVTGSITDEEAPVRATENCDAVVNLVGTTAARTETEFFALHCDAPERLAETATARGTRRFVQFSAMGVSRTAPAAADRSKAAGEDAVRTAFPNATIVRPSLVFGDGDHFFGRFVPLMRRMPVVPLLGGGDTKFEPMHVADLVDAVMRLLESEDARGYDYDLGGPDVLTLRELLDRLGTALGRNPWLAPVPFGLAEVLARAAEHVPGAPITADQVRLLRTDKVHRPGSRLARDLGVTPRSIETHYSALRREMQES